MIVLNSAAAFEGNASAVALGMFDGVHIGHQRLIRRAVELAHEIGALSVVCTFDQHPLEVLCPQRAPKRLLSLEENLEKFERLGADCALVAPFTRAFAATEPEAYLQHLVTDMRAKAIVVGENYTFGRAGRGNTEMICALAEELGVRAEVVEPVMDGNRMASSTYVRELLRDGQVAHAARLMAISAENVRINA